MPADRVGVTWLQDRRGYGALRLRVQRRQARRASWLGDQLRRRRRAFLRANWLLLLKVVGAWVVVLASTALVRHQPHLRDFLLGLYTGLGPALLWFLLAAADGSLNARLGRSVEEQVGDELRTTRGVYGVVSGVPFRGCDVDHVVLSPAGVSAVEVKWLGAPGRSDRLEDVYRLSGKLAQAKNGALRVQQLLHSEGVTWVRPVLVLAGPGTPDLPEGGLRHEDVVVVSFRHSNAWRPSLAGGASVRHAALELDVAEACAHALLAFRKQRWDHEASRPT